MVEEKQSGFFRKEVAWLLSHRPAAAPGAPPSPAASPLPGARPCPWARLLSRPRPQVTLPRRPRPLPSLQTQAPSTGEQAMAFSQEQRALQSTP